MIHPRTPRARSVALAGLLLATVGGSCANAQDDAPAAPNAQSRQVAQETLSPTSTLTVREIVMAPGEVAPAHRHSGSVFVYVLEGSVRSQINDEPAVLYHAGDSWFEPEGVIHTLAENPSETDAVRLLAVAVAPSGEPFAKAPAQ
jgi:quercetin dioxygenase-like cupin family protein